MALHKIAFDFREIEILTLCKLKPLQNLVPNQVDASKNVDTSLERPAIQNLKKKAQ